MVGLQYSLFVHYVERDLNEILLALLIKLVILMAYHI